ncbi:PGPGW domain-containing protein [Kribbella sp.]|uniref:PGPGW domain-containing protein n=1 Tax=Kribbella sp. TaxID=1871183 RepID=UPI002D5384F8|nr:PGPGW domain-containing protein [Kribbella sp.]HZX01879.1 PGPGW domain-containing protein [Kribbella sp.]
MAEKESPDRTDDNLTLDAADDRWEWRRRIRENPKKLLFYRIGVGVLGGLLLLAAPLTGWLPGPGGIPLFIAGLAVLASEFEWAQRLLCRVNDWVKSLTAWTGKQPGWLKALGTAALSGCVVAGVWLYLAVLGVPGWLPDSWESFLYKVPLLD